MFHILLYSNGDKDTPSHHISLFASYPFFFDNRSRQGYFNSFLCQLCPEWCRRRTGTNLSDSVGCSPFPSNIVQRFRKYSGYCVIFSYRHKKSTPKGASRIEYYSVSACKNQTSSLYTASNCRFSRTVSSPVVNARAYDIPMYAIRNISTISSVAISFRISPEAFARSITSRHI